MIQNALDRIKDLWGSSQKSRRACSDYGCKIWYVTIESIALIIFTITLSATILYICKMMWSISSSTIIGDHFTAAQPALSQSISKILAPSPFFLSATLVLYSCVISTCIGSFCQFFHISRHYFFTLSSLDKTIYWGLPITVLTTIVVKQNYHINLWLAAYGIALLPTLCVFSGCFKFCGDLLPELGAIFKLYKRHFTRPVPKEQRTIVKQEMPIIKMSETQQD